MLSKRSALWTWIEQRSPAQVITGYYFLAMVLSVLYDLARGFPSRLIRLGQCNDERRYGHNRAVLNPVR
ncbi:hypothetical protein [Paenibacillus aestuarii]|uniref:Uncharacterized protein n=1 Tax=Paenibacillus aestuarii TaxID=516965 RepID=A0ABW0K618_9BACL|nr:hypothetical protein [Paenibacillus aestuarii]